MALVITDLIVWRDIIGNAYEEYPDKSILRWLEANVGMQTPEPILKTTHDVGAMNHRYQFHGEGWTIDYQDTWAVNPEREEDINKGICAARSWSPIINVQQYRLHFEDEANEVLFKLTWLCQ